MGRDKFFDMLRREDLLIKRKYRKAKTTNSKHWLKRHPYLLDNMKVDRSELLWVSDITYLKTSNGFVYLSLITDAYFHKIVGHCLHPTLEAEGCLKALEEAVKNRIYRNRPLIHHSDPEGSGAFNTVVICISES